jgi:Glycosyltransferase family 28 N-terminal domain
MHVTMLTVGSRGDVQPFVAFGVGLQDAGHRVRICTHPRFRALVEGQGLEFAPLAQGAVARRGETEGGGAGQSIGRAGCRRGSGCSRTRVPWPAAGYAMPTLAATARMSSWH